MDLATLERIVPELEAALIGQRFGKVFVLSRLSIAADFRLNDSEYLFISVEPADPRIYLIRRRLRDLERASGSPLPFILQLRKLLSGFECTAVEQVSNERVLKLRFRGMNEMDEPRSRSLVVQLTGKSANLFVLDENERILDALRETLGEGQEIGSIYSPPARTEGGTAERDDKVFSTDGFATLSEALDAADLEKKAEAEFRSLANTARSKIEREIAKLRKLRKRLSDDLRHHGDAEQWKRFGDLLLANVGTAKRQNSKFVVTDYFDENVPNVEIEAAENDSVTETAERYFKKYTKARNAREEIAKRMDATEREVGRLEERLAAIDKAIEERDVDLLREHVGVAPQKEPTKKTKESPVSSVARIFTSSDGFEILVGKRAKDNDYLTFRIAKSLDTWMHAADYPGSHVVIRNPNRNDIPHRTLLEAAQLAAFYSQGKTQPKAAVHYTQKKFVNKPKGAAPGLVSLASFKTLLVEPRVPETLSAPKVRG